MKKVYILLLLIARLSVVITLVSLLQAAPLAQAEPYGRNSFGSCAYQSNCKHSTEFTLPSGLQVSVNLTDRQIIPRRSYTVIVTPLNGAGSSFNTVDFYVNGNLAYTAAPDATGTAKWVWTPDYYADAMVKLIVTGSDGMIVEKQFNIGFEPAVATNNVVGSTDPPGDGPAQINQGNSLIAGAQRAIQSLPRPLLYSFPYILLLLLGVNAVLLFLQLQREVLAYRKLQQLSLRGKLISEAKTTLAELVAHYLRTPLAVLSAAIDLLQTDKTNLALAQQMTDVRVRLQATVERLVSAPAQTTGEYEKQAVAAGWLSKLWARLGVWLPLLLAAIVIVSLDYIMQSIASLGVSAVNVGIQAACLVALAVSVVIVVRGRQINRRDRDALQLVMRAEAAIAGLRDGLIDDAAQSLRSDIGLLERLAAGLPDTKAAHFVTDGISRFHQLVTKLEVARKLRGTSSTDPPQPVNFSRIVPDTAPIIARHTDKKGVIVEVGDDLVLMLSSPELISFALESLIDNAVAYSPDTGTVRVTAMVSETGTILSVTDSGAGIAADKLQQLFQPFFKAEGAETFSHEGMGFSLYLDKLIAEYMGGDIMVESVPGAGTAVHLRLPALA